MPNIHFNGNGSITLHCLRCNSSEDLTPRDDARTTKKDWIETVEKSKN